MSGWGVMSLSGRMDAGAGVTRAMNSDRVTHAFAMTFDESLSNQPLIITSLPRMRTLSGPQDHTVYKTNEACPLLFLCRIVALSQAAADLTHGLSQALTVLHDGES